MRKENKHGEQGRREKGQKSLLRQHQASDGINVRETNSFRVCKAQKQDLKLGGGA